MHGGYGLGNSGLSEGGMIGLTIGTRQSLAAAERNRIFPFYPTPLEVRESGLQFLLRSLTRTNDHDVAFYCKLIIYVYIN